MVKDQEQETSVSALKTDPSSPADDLTAEVEDLHDPQDPLYTLPVSERRRGKGGTKRRTSTRSHQPEDLDIEEARTKKAEKAEELYATLPPIVGVIGHFNKGECVRKCLTTSA